MATMKIKNLTIQLFTKFEEKDQAKSISGRRWNADYKCWEYPLTQAILNEIKDTFKDLEDQVNQAKADLKKTTEVAVAASKAASADIVVEGLGGELLPFQKAGVAYALDKKRCFIADEMGLGKTVQALATIQAANAYPAIIICPAVVKKNWEKEAKKWLPGKSVSVISSGKKANYDADVVIINYDIVNKHLDELLEIIFKIAILDESHYCKNGKAARTKAVTALTEDIDNRLLLSGTPLTNNPSELISQLKILGRLNEMGGWKFFVDRYCDATQTRWGWDISGAKNLKELNDKLRSLCYVRRNKADVLKELPEKRRSKVTLTLDKAFKKEYLDAVHSLVAYLHKQGKSGEEIEKAQQAEHLVQIETLKQICVKGKMNAAKEWIADFLESGEKLIVFASHKEVVKALKAEFPGAVSITGENNEEQKQAVVEKFQNDPETKLAILGIRAASVGITMTAASNVAFLELGWTPAEHDQAEDRCHRIGQQNAVNAWYLLAEGTIDEDIAELIDKKRIVVTAAADGKRVKAEDGILKELIAKLLQAQKAA